MLASAADDCVAENSVAENVRSSHVPSQYSA